MILVVEDDAETRAAMRLVLQRHGHEVCEASDGLEACDRLLATGRDVRLVFLDLEMPSGNGRDCLRTIKGVASPWADIVVVIVTGTEIDLGGDESLADYVLVKPTDPVELISLAAEHDPPQPRGG